MVLSIVLIVLSALCVWLILLLLLKNKKFSLLQKEKKLLFDASDKLVLYLKDKNEIELTTIWFDSIKLMPHKGDIIIINSPFQNEYHRSFPFKIFKFSNSKVHCAEVVLSKKWCHAQPFINSLIKTRDKT